jgi:hypothetical protein
VLLQVAIHCGVPAAIGAFRTARETFAKIDGARLSGARPRALRHMRRCQR